MSEGLERLRSIGAQKIHEETHIAHKYIQAILHENFEGMQRIQLMGFISILEREYHKPLDELRNSANSYFEAQEEAITLDEPEYKKKLLVSSKPQSKLPYIVGGIIVVIALVIYFMTSSSSKEIQPVTTDAKEESTLTQKEPETSSYVDASIPIENYQKQLEEKQVKDKKIVRGFTIIPKSKVWVGYIDLATDRKQQKIITEPLELNASKEYLLAFGHGYIDIDLNGKLREFKEPNKIKFLYRNGELRQIDNAKFKRYNKGKLW